MIHVTASTLRAHGVPKATAHRWIARAIDAGSYPTATVRGRTRPATALVMDDESFALLVAGLTGTREAQAA